MSSTIITDHLLTGWFSCNSICLFFWHIHIVICCLRCLWLNFQSLPRLAFDLIDNWMLHLWDKDVYHLFYHEMQVRKFDENEIDQWINFAGCIFVFIRKEIRVISLQDLWKDRPGFSFICEAENLFFTNWCIIINNVASGSNLIVVGEDDEHPN